MRDCQNFIVRGRRRVFCANKFDAKKAAHLPFRPQGGKSLSGNRGPQTFALGATLIDRALFAVHLLWVRHSARRSARGEGVGKTALYFAIAIAILIGAFLVVQNFEAAAGRDVAPHVDMTALGIVLVVAVTAAFIIATFAKRR
jgi:hypothetical protein